MENHLTMFGALRFGWDKTRAHSAIVFQVVLAFFTLGVVRDIVDRVLGSTATGALASLGLWILSVFIGVGATVIVLKLVRSEHATLGNLLPSWQLVWKFFVAGVCAGVLMALPFILAMLIAMWDIVHTLGWNQFMFLTQNLEQGMDPVALRLAATALLQALSPISFVAFAVALVCTLYLGLRYSMVRFEIIDGAGIVESLRKSAILTMGRKWWLLGFGVVAMLINIVGAIPFGLGLLVTIPVTYLAFAHIYDKLRAHHS